MKDLLDNYTQARDELLKYYEQGARNFKRVTLSQSRFSNVALVKADFSYSNFASAEFDNVDLRQSIFQGADLSHTKISGSNLSQADLRGVNLERADFNDANLEDANLDSANLSEASLKSNNLQGANLGQALLQGADLSEACLQNANLSLANLAQATLVGADLSTANLDRAILTNAVYNTSTRLPEGFDPVQAGMEKTESDTSAGKQLLERYRLGERDFRRIALTRAYLSRADLRGVDFSGADLTKADLRNANLQGVIFKGANLGYASLGGADLTGADLRGVNLSHIQFKQGILTNAKLDRANFRGANLAGTNLSEASLEQASLMGVNLSNANLSNTNLSNANLSNANLTEANLTRANLSGADLKIATLNGAVFDDVLQSESTCWPDGVDPVSIGLKSSERSNGETDNLPSLLISDLPAATKPTPTPSGEPADLAAQAVGTDDFLKRSFAFKPAIYLAFVLLAVATLGGGSYTIYALLQRASSGSNGTDSRISSTDLPLQESNGVSLPTDDVVGDLPSDERFIRASEHHSNGELKEAIALLQSIPEDDEDYDLVQDTLNVWLLESDLEYVDIARQELESQNWQAAVEATESIVDAYWKTEALSIADEAHYRLALEALERDDIENAELAANSISDEIRQKEILTAILNRQAEAGSDLQENNAVADPEIPSTKPQEPLPETAFAQQARDAFARNDWLGTVEAARQIETPDILETILPLVDEAYHQLAHEAEDRGDWQTALDYANATVTEQGKIQTAPMVQRIEAAISGTAP